MSNTEEPRVVGSVVTARGIRPFVHHPDGHVESEFLPNPRQGPLSGEQQRQAQQRVARALGPGVQQVRVGHYHCYDCGRWIELDGSQWSLGMCFNCSFDRSSEIADR